MNNLFYQLELREKEQLVTLTWEKEIWHTIQLERRGEVSKIQMAGNTEKKTLTLMACTVCNGKKERKQVKKV